MPTTPTPNVLQDPGYLLWAPLGSAEPVNTIVGSVFTDAWPVAWINLGATEDGSEFSSETKVEPVRVAEFFDPVRYNTTERESSVAFALADFTLANLKRIQNGGTLTVVSGAGTTQLNKFQPPLPGQEVRSMIGWESLDSTLRLICHQTLQGGAIKVANKKRPAIATLPGQFNLEVPSSGFPYTLYSAGTSRA